MTTLLTLKNLSLTHPHKTIFQDVTFTLNKGDRIGVLGLNGHGKTSLFNIIAGKTKADTTVPPFIYDKNKDLTFFYVPQELPALEDWIVEDYYYYFNPQAHKIKQELNAIGEKLGTINDNFDALLERQTELFDQLNHMQDHESYDRYLNYLTMFGVENINRKMNSLSGGEQRKVCLSLGLSTTAELILWDEPTNHLDFETIEKFEDELTNSAKTFMIISHDRSLLTNVVDRIIHIQKGKLRSFSGTYNAYLEFLITEDIRLTKEIDKLSNIQRRETAWIRRGAKARRTKSKKRIEDYSILNKSIQDLKDQAHKSASLKLKSSGRKTKEFIQVKDLSFGYEHLAMLFQNCNLVVAQGDKIALCGGNGAGKTTLLNLLMQNIKPTKGSVTQVDNLTIGHFSQKRESLSLTKTPWDLIGEGIDFVISNTGEKRHVASYLEQFLFSSEEIKRPISTFSGGEKNRLQLAQFMKHSKDLWIFDEPTNDLDLETIGILEEELRNYQGALIVVGHDRSFLANVTNKCWIIHDQEIEIFEAGFEQAQEYLEALALQESLKKKLPQQAPLKNQNTASSTLSNKEFRQLETLAKLVTQLENEIAQIESDVAKLNYQDRTPENLSHIEQTRKKLNDKKNEYEDVFNQWAQLEEKKSPTK
jgi:ATP-binding cassette subfamily F protein uup